MSKLVVTTPVDKTGVPLYKNEPVCGVLSLAVVSGNTVGDVKTYFRGIKGNRWKGALYPQEITDYMDDHNVPYIDVTYVFLPGMNKLRDIAMYASLKYADKAVMYILNNHVCVSCNRVICDQTSSVDIMDFWGLNKKVEAVYLIDAPAEGILAGEFKRGKKIVKNIFSLLQKDAGLWIRSGRKQFITATTKKYGISDATASVYYYKLKEYV